MMMNLNMFCASMKGWDLWLKYATLIFIKYNNGFHLWLTNNVKSQIACLIT
jgi:hypothetical protein